MFTTKCLVLPTSINLCYCVVSTLDHQLLTAPISKSSKVKPVDLDDPMEVHRFEGIMGMGIAGVAKSIMQIHDLTLSQRISILDSLHRASLVIIEVHYHHHRQQREVGGRLRQGLTVSGEVPHPNHNPMAAPSMDTRHLLHITQTTNRMAILAVITEISFPATTTIPHLMMVDMGVRTIVMIDSYLFKCCFA